MFLKIVEKEEAVELKEKLVITFHVMEIPEELTIEEQIILNEQKKDEGR